MGASDEAFLTRLAIAADIVSPTRMDLTRFEEAHPAGDGIQELVADKGITAARCLAAPEANFQVLWYAQSTSFILTLSACSKRRNCKGWQVEHFRATGYRVWLFRFRLQQHTFASGSNLRSPIGIVEIALGLVAVRKGQYEEGRPRR
jgi:hypothetical protein